MAADALQAFDPVVREWFRERLGDPTEIQELAWPPIVAGRHVLVTAPTGSGKTLTGFLGPLDRLLTGAWEGGATRVLYVSPLKALNADIERNLRQPLAELTAAFEAAGTDPEPVRVGLRSGDTPPAERARMVRRPPEILITTPESLNLLLLSRHAGRLFAGLRMVILDEIHAVLGSKRGTHLITAVERLTRIAGEFQRVAISATVRPLEEVARFVGGYELKRGAGGGRYEPRAVQVVAARSAKSYELSVRWPLPQGIEAADLREGDAFWQAIAEDLHGRIAEVRSSIVFTNSRRTAEKITRLVNDAAGRELAWSHHGSLARELRAAVEARLKAGDLPAIVATSSLELGIDVGALERVVLLSTPRSLASAAQRIGRAGHRAGETSRAIFVPTHPRDFLDAAVAARAVPDGEIEPVRPVRAPLDLLAQVVLAMVAGETWKIDELFEFLRTAAPYHELSRTQFDLVVEMLAGRYADARIEELRPRVRVDRIDGTIAGRPGLARLLAQTGGTIPDRGYFALKIEESQAKLGELDEEFVWERTIGDSFTLGAQSWRIRAITAHEVLVAPGRGGTVLAPFWRADAQDRRSFYSERVARFLEEANDRLADEGFAAELERERFFEPGAAAELVRILGEQRAALGVDLPHRHHLVIEECDARGGDEGRRQFLLYTFWGGTLNRPLAMALAGLWEEREGDRVETMADDDAVLLVLPAGADVRGLVAALDPERIEDLLRRRLEGSGFFGAHFRQNAQRAMLLPRASPRRRTPLWVSRQNAKKLLEAVGERDDFPLVLETWRTCLQDEFELDVLRERLRELRAGAVRVSAVRSGRPSPFSANLVWRRTNEQMYEDDVPEARRKSALRGDLLREVALAASDRPRIPRALAERYRRTAQRLLPGYPPREPDELLEWVKERFWLAEGEWEELLAAVDSELRGAGELPSAQEMVSAIAPKLVTIDLPDGTRAIAAAEAALLARESAALRAAFERGRALSGAGAVPGQGNDRQRAERARQIGQKDKDVQRGVKTGAEVPILATSPAAGAASSLSGSLLASAGTEADSGPTEAAAFAAVLGPWLRFHAPLPFAEVAERFGVEESLLGATVDLLVREERVVRGALLEGGEEDEIVARSSLETLLRWRRAEARPELEPIPLSSLPLLVAWQQGLVERGEGVEGLQSAVDRLFGFPAPAEAWEREILPARLDPYLPAWLDTLFDESGLRWLGVGPERVALAFPADFDLLGVGVEAAGPESTGDPAERELEARIVAALSGARRGLELGELVEGLGSGSAEVSAALWRLAWRGVVVADSMRALRQGILAGFRAESAGEASSVAAPRGARRAAFRRWSGGRSFAGRWLLAASPTEGEGDALEEEERSRERVRLLAERWGVLFRELLARELPELGWGRLARTMRRLELAGELVAGQFVAGVRGLQFATPAVARRLAAGLPEAGIWWQSAIDPASLCGIDLAGLKADLPRRQAGTWLVWEGARLVAIYRRSGREIELRAREATLVPALIEPLRVALTRGFAPERSLRVETIDGEPAERSPFRAAFAAFSVTREARGLRLRRSYDR